MLSVVDAIPRHTETCKCAHAHKKIAESQIVAADFPKNMISTGENFSEVEFERSSK